MGAAQCFGAPPSLMSQSGLNLEWASCTLWLADKLRADKVLSDCAIPVAPSKEYLPLPSSCGAISSTDPPEPRQVPPRGSSARKILWCLYLRLGDVRPEARCITSELPPWQRCAAQSCRIQSGYLLTSSPSSEVSSAGCVSSRLVLLLPLPTRKIRPLAR